MDEPFDIIQSIINLANHSIQKNDIWNDNNQYSMSDYLKDNAHKLLHALIDHQHKCPESDERKNEDNIKLGIRYEFVPSKCLSLIQHMNQDVGSRKKLDLIYHGATQDDSLEFKSGYFNLLYKRAKVDWAKKNGNPTREESVYKFLDTVPDGCLIYQKFDVDEGIPALLAYITKEKLVEVSNRITQSDTNVFIHIDLKDCEWHEFEVRTPKKKPGYNDAKKLLKNCIDLITDYASDQLSRDYATDEYIVCDAHNIEFKSARGMRGAKKQVVVDEMRRLRDHGHSIHEIAKITKVRHKTIRGWLEA